MSQDLQITGDKTATKIILTVSGKIDSVSANQFASALNKAQKESPFIDVNMKNVTFLSSMGIRSVLLSYRQLKLRNGEFRIVAPSDQVKNVIGMVNLDLMLAK